jgi:hypothetical protein
MNVKSAIAATLAAAFLLAGVATAGRRYESHIYFENKSDAFVWVTAYERNTDIIPGQMGKTVGAWCVAPGQPDRHGVSARVNEVRAEVSAGGCQRHVALNQLRGFPYGEHDGQFSHTMTYYIHGKNGTYVYSNTP